LNFVRLEITAHVSKSWLKMNLPDTTVFVTIWSRVTEWFNSLAALVLQFFQAQPTIESDQDIEATKSQILVTLEESVAGDVAPPVVDEADVKVDIEDEKQKPILDLDNVELIDEKISNIAKSITKSFQVQEVLDENQEKTENQGQTAASEEKLENWDSNYTLDFEEDSEDEETKQKPEILGGYTGAFKNYIDLVVHTNEVVQTVELESDQWKQAVRLRPFKSTDRLQEWTTDVNSSDHDLETVRIVVDGSRVAYSDIEKIKKDDGTIQFTIKHK
jgi:hypothetical protein